MMSLHPRDQIGMCVLFYFCTFGVALFKKPVEIHYQCWSIALVMHQWETALPVIGRPPKN